MCTDTKSAKNDILTAFFALLESALVKAESKMLVKLTKGVNFINILCKALMHTDTIRAKKTDNLNVFFALLGSALVKAESKMLVKLTPNEMKASETLWV